ncbi:MAG: 3-deoxy-D-manno-octulosonic acid transferase [Rhodoferax sp.]|nr:3-deoxy-D-manno-octulosonic acid transferase [Rhodoferax sp.]MDP3650571.1 3-deoxy-D-manno-octulosonic acid transferase [Rhodoferax sp.]
MMLRLYSWAMWLVQPLLRRKLHRRARAEPGYGEAIEERFGYYTHPAQAAQRMAPAPAVAGGEPALVWVHAVSLGETRAVAVLVAQLRSQLPGMRLLLTHGTATGRAQGRALLQPGDVQVWQPWDTPGAVGRFLAHFRPRIGLLVETEVWPNLVAGCARAGVPLCLVNARLSDKSLRQAQRLAWLSRPAYRGLAAVWAQSADDAARLSQLGAPVQGVLGNFKFDATPDAAQLAQGRAWRQVCNRPVLMFASSREGEEQLLLDILKQIRALAPVEYAQAAPKTIAKEAVQWLIVPRHPQRFDAVATLLAAQGFTVARRSAWADAPPEADIWLGDSLGEMALYFGMADVALLGGSFAPLGGQNLIEAAACGCPVLMGPHTFNFAEATALAQAAGAAFAQPDLPTAVAQALALVHTPAELAQARSAALSWSQAHRGAALRTALAVKGLLVG